MRNIGTYVNLEVSVKKHLELERFFALVAHVEHGLQAVLAKCDGVHKTELIRPSLLVFLREVGRAEAKVDLDRVIAALGQGAGFGRGAAQVFPSGVASEAVLWESAGCVVLGRRSECLGSGSVLLCYPCRLSTQHRHCSCLTYREDDGNTSSDGLAAIHDSSIADKDVLLAVVLPADHSSSIQHHLNGVACREGCVNAALLDVNRRLWATRRGRDGAGLVGTVHGCSVV
jgi:hypothetical protein